MAACVFPVPELPIRQQFECSSTHCPRDSSNTFCLGSDGMTLKSKVSKSLITGKPAARIREAIALAVRVATSASVNLSR
jgi:hypothetical protein